MSSAYESVASLFCINIGESKEQTNTINDPLSTSSLYLNLFFIIISPLFFPPFSSKGILESATYFHSVLYRIMKYMYIIATCSSLGSARLKKLYTPGTVTDTLNKTFFHCGIIFISKTFLKFFTSCRGCTLWIMLRMIVMMMKILIVVIVSMIMTIMWMNMLVAVER